MKPDLSINIGSMKLKNPVITASGTFGYGTEFSGLVDLEKLGAIVVKTITLNPVIGNPPPRIVEVTSGIINSVGLQNEGVDNFISEKLPAIKDLGVPIIVSIAGNTVKEYKELAERLDKEKDVSALEINISCPNVKEGGLAFGIDPKWTNTVVKNVCGVTEKPVITKLSPNVTSVIKIAESAVDGGTEAISLVNTFVAMAIDIYKMRPKIASVTGGLSGPCIKPIALRMVWEVANKLDVPVIGMGGIADAADALEFLIAGAGAVAVGTANFVNPRAVMDIIAGIEDYLRERNISSVKDIIKGLKV